MSGITSITFEHGYSRSTGKLHGPAPSPSASAESPGTPAAPPSTSAESPGLGNAGSDALGRALIYEVVKNGR